MVVHNPNNWHWVDKNCFPWAKEYFNKELIGLNTGNDQDKFAEIASISSLEGDCEVNQRKGKVISLFDMQLVVLIKGKSGGEDFEGSISVPEIAFDSEESDYQFDISIYKETAKLNEVKPIIREKLLPQLRKLFKQFGNELLAAHGSAIQLPEEQVNSAFTKANQQSSLTSQSKPSIEKTTENEERKPHTSSSTPKGEIPALATSGGNTTSIHLEPTFNVPAEELYRTFIDKNRITAWSRSGINCLSGGGSEVCNGDVFELFGGNVTSELIASVPNKKLVFKWRLKDWRAKVFSSMCMEFHESKEYHETKLQVTWTGIPVGEEDRVRGNFEDYYVRSIKLTFGFGAVL